MASLTIYPDAGSGGSNTSVDGWAKRGTASSTWADIHGGAGTDSADTSDGASSSVSSHASDTDRFTELSRPIILFDASALPSAFFATAGQVRLYIDDKTRSANWGALNPTFGIYASTPASNTAVIDSDYQQVASTLLSDTFAYDDITENAFNTFTLNAAGLAAIVDGIVKLAFRISYDATNTPPAWAGNSQIGIGFQMADKAGGNPAELIITYAEGFPSDPLVRVTDLVIHWSAGPDAVYQMQVLTGGLFSQYFSPISAEKEPTPTLQDRQPARDLLSQMVPTLREYGEWLGNHTQAQQRAILRGIPGATIMSLEIWQGWVLRLRMMGQEIP